MAESARIRDLSEQLVHALSAAGKTVTTAESCTGGWIAKAITDIAGSSAVFAYGIVSYSNGAKESLLGVNPQTLIDNGAVDRITVAEMAEGAIKLSGADFSVAVSGIAGPDGGSDDKPLGTVCFAWSERSGEKINTDTDRQHFDGDRDAVRRQSVLHALAGIQDRLRA
ncbi:MAG: nicotinamide-nucleotide amidohydrolase family protein [Gammaproteobacteria bacterium]|nr:nicotinamide-nucleotide amidohydrolase family protein [Gammaproteobacteria bacterium]